MGGTVASGAPVSAPADVPLGAPLSASGRPAIWAARLRAADPLLVARRHVDYLRIGSALCLPRPLSIARYS
jgi:hypothetical protein